MAGPSLADLFNGNQGKKIFSYLKTFKTSNKINNGNNNNKISIFKNEKNGVQIKSNRKYFINRNLIFFCSAMNRHAGFFRKYNIIKQNIKEYSQKIGEDVLNGKFLNKTKISMFLNYVENASQIIRKINFDHLMSLFCSFDSEKFTILKKQVNNILNNKIREENEKGD